MGKCWKHTLPAFGPSLPPPRWFVLPAAQSHACFHFRPLPCCYVPPSVTRWRQAGQICFYIFQVMLRARVRLLDDEWCLPLLSFSWSSWNPWKLKASWVRPSSPTDFCGFYRSSILNPGYAFSKYHWTEWTRINYYSLQRRIELLKNYSFIVHWEDSFF